jgi:hypothetical protein
MGGPGMSIANYQWLIVGEGTFDVGTYTKLLVQFGVSNFLVKCVEGKGNVFHMNKWEELPKKNHRIVSQKTVQTDQGRYDFMGIVLVVDSDKKENLEQNYADYSEECRSKHIDYADWQTPYLIDTNPFIMRLDTLKGVNGRKLPIYGLCVPVVGRGCLETDLLRAYGYPVEEKDYDQFADTIKSASQSWGAGSSNDVKEWWRPEYNGKARMDKFMYAALMQGFKVNNLTTRPIPEPQIITNIKNAIGIDLCDGMDP